MRYRADIDGLRAIAILFVLFFHAGFKLFPSGFIGVDIFFVISGFLITSIISHSLDSNDFSFTDFYNRRLWRLQPVFICLLLSTLLLTLIFYLPEDLIRYSKSARKTSLFLANTFFERATKGYFSPNVNQLPLLHSWSLSIEWQCYLILPLTLYVFYRIVPNQKQRAKVTYLLTLFFLTLALYFSTVEPAKNYYQLASRLFEFLMGSCIVFKQKPFTLNKYIVEIFNVIAVIVLFYIAMHADIKIGFPNWYAIFLCCATSLLIISGSSYPNTIIARLLSIKPIVFIGLISYSLYIWHWPIFAFIRYLKIDETYKVLGGVFILIFVIGYLSWRFIEKPARKFHSMRFGYSLICLLLFPIILIHLSDYAIKKNAGYPQRFKEMARIDKQLKKFSYPMRSLCLQDKSVEINPQCVLGSKSYNRRGFMFGDSHANHLWGFMDALAQDANISILAHSTAACLSLPGIKQFDWNKEIYVACQEQIERYYNLIKKNHYDFVILGQNWDGYLSGKLSTPESVEATKQRIEKALDKALQIIISSGSTPVILKTVVVNNSYSCFFNHIKLRKSYDPNECNFTMPSTWQDNFFSSLQNKYSQLIIVDPKEGQCVHGLCNAEINGIPIFRDSGHITDYASYQFAIRYLKFFQNPLT